MRSFAPARRPRCKAHPWALPCGPAFRLSKLRIPSLGFALTGHAAHVPHRSRRCGRSKLDHPGLAKSPACAVPWRRRSERCSSPRRIGLCSAKEKGEKKGRPTEPPLSGSPAGHAEPPCPAPYGRLAPCKSALLPICLAQSGGRPTGHPCPDGRRRASLRVPFQGLVRFGLRCSAAPRGPTHAERCAGHYKRCSYVGRATPTPHRLSRYHLVGNAHSTQTKPTLSPVDSWKLR